MSFFGFSLSLLITFYSQENIHHALKDLRQSGNRLVTSGEGEGEGEGETLT